MRIHELLLEYNQQKTVQAYGQKLYDRLEKENDTFSKELFKSINTPQEIVFWFEQNDPTQDKKYTDWMIRSYVNGNIEHIKEIPSRLGGKGNALYLLNRLSSSGHLENQDKNIDSYKNITQLENRIEDYYKNEAYDKEFNNQAKEFFKTGEAELVYNGPDYRIVIPKTYKANCYFGTGTKWCTTSKEEQSHWNYYSKKGTFYYIYDKRNQEKIAINFGVQQYKDQHENDIKREILLNQYPKLLKILFEKEGGKKSVVNKDPSLGILLYPNNEKIQLKAVKHDPFSIKLIDNPSEKVQLEAVKQSGFLIQTIKNPSEKVQIEAVKQEGLVIQYINNPSEKVQLEAVKQSGFLIQTIKNPSEKVQIEAVKQDNEAIDFIENPSEKVKRMVYDNE